MGASRLFAGRSQQLLERPLAWPASTVHLRRVDSTQRLARRYAEALAKDDELPLPTLFIAFEQTTGRGRLGNRWASPAGEGLYASWLIDLPLVTTVLPLRVGASLAAGLSGISPSPVGLKWPNDLWIDGRKVGGILIETFSGAAGKTLAAIGLGLNLSLKEAAAGEYRATSMRGVSWMDALTTCSRAVQAVVEAPETPDLDSIERLLIHRRGEALRFRSGGRRIEGSYEGLDELGRIRVGVEGGVESFASGEVIEE
jgi:BirA family biotin operon repressor/biotin-[acetyl-CoA-carboxylase] ligase